MAATHHKRTGLALRAAFALAIFPAAALAGPWPMHVIDDTARGADGVRFADADGDGDQDIATGWEESGVVRVYLQPAANAVRDPWPHVSVGTVASPEDAVLVDVDADGAVDVVSSCEGGTRAVYVHWAPARAEDYLDESAWQTAEMPNVPRVQWMFAAPADIDGKNGIDLIVGAKNDGAQLGWLESPATPRDLATWTWHPLCAVGWTMSIIPHDMDDDGDIDVLVSDRRGATRGVFWLEHPGPTQVTGVWKRHGLFGADAEVMFMDRVDWSGGWEMACATADKGIVAKSMVDSIPRHFPWPARGGTGKSAALGDLDNDGQVDLVVSAEHAEDAYGVQWAPLSAKSGQLTWQPVSTLQGVKYDAVRLLDIDRDGDLDVVTCEENENLGVIWYENNLK